MEIAHSSRTVETTQSEWRLYHITDTHVDSRDFAEKELLEFINRIKNDDMALWAGGGDYADLILPGDPRFGDGMVEGAPSQRVPYYAIETVTDLLMPIRDKCIGFGIGNHEYQLMRRYHHGIGFEIARNLSVPHLYLGMRGWMPVTFRRKNSQSMTLKIYWYHGWSAGRSKSRKVLHEERDYGARDAHVHLVGHDHQPWINTWYREELYYTSRGKHKWRQRWSPVCFMNGGAWVYGQVPPDRKKVAKAPSQITNEVWVETKNYRPEPPRSPVLHINVDFGRGREKKPDGGGQEWAGRPIGFDFTEEMASPRFFPEGE